MTEAASITDMFDYNERYYSSRCKLITETLDILAHHTIQDKRLYIFVSIIIKGIHYIKVNVYKYQPNKYKWKTEVTEVLHMQ